MARHKDHIFAGLDIGTTKVCVLVVRGGEDGRLEVAGTGYAASQGLRKGIVVDLEAAGASIRRAAEEAELKSGVSLDWVTVGISGEPIQSFNCHGAIAIEGKHQEVTPDDVAQVIQAARSIPIPPEREVIHVLPQEFLLDNRGDIANPIGLRGSRLDVNVHVVTSEAALVQNLIHAVNRSQMRVQKVVLQQLASAEAVLSADEKELGAAVIDVGGGTTDVALMVRKAVRFTSVLPVGGDHFTRDLAVALRTPIEDAEQIKKEWGGVQTEGIAADEIVEVPGVGTREARAFPRAFVCEVLRDRADEVLELVRAEIDRSGLRESLTAGVVLTGGGSQLDGLLDLAETILEMPVRQGLPQGIAGLPDELAHPVYATAVGLALCGTQSVGDGRPKPKPGGAPWPLQRLLSWVGS